MGDFGFPTSNREYDTYRQTVKVSSAGSMECGGNGSDERKDIRYGQTGPAQYAANRFEEVDPETLGVGRVEAARQRA